MNIDDKRILELPFLKNVEKDKIDSLLNLAEIIEIDKNHIISKQFEHSHSFYFLVRGEVNFSISV